MKKIALGFMAVMLLALSGCAGMNPSSLPGQEQAPIEDKALVAQQAFLQALAPQLKNFTTSVVFEPVDPEKPMTITNARAVLNVVDSRFYDMVVGLNNFQQYKSAPGFWSWANNLTDRILGIAQVVAPWYFAKEMVVAARGGSPAPNNYNINNRGDGNATNIQGDFGRGAGWSFQPSKPVAVVQPVVVGQ